ncbi:uncharacterized protein [Palaemon carinicauda]|uniref:uncharacterized protein n=1 Tax=Palaemon carinicauda TaxID=392227 RepID=UPI0035B5B098
MHIATPASNVLLIVGNTGFSRLIVGDTGFSRLIVGNTGFSRLIVGNTGFSRMIVGNTGFSRLIVGNTGFSRLIVGDTGFSRMIVGNTGFSRMIVGNTGFSRLIVGDTGFSRLIVGNTGFSRLIVGNTGFSRLIVGNTGFSRLIVGNTGFSRMIVGNTGFSRLIVGNTRFSMMIVGNTGFSRLIVGNTGFSRMIVGNTGFSRLIVGNTGFSTLIVGNTGFSRLIVGNTGFSRLIVGNTGFSTLIVENTGFSTLIVGNTGFSRLIVRNTGFSTLIVGNTGFSRLIFGNTGFSRLIVGNTGFSTLIVENTGFSTLIVGNTGFSWLVVGNTGFSRLIVGNTGFSRLIVGNTGFSRMIVRNTGFSRLIVRNTGLPKKQMEIRPIFEKKGRKSISFIIAQRHSLCLALESLAISRPTVLDKVPPLADAILEIIENILTDEWIVLITEIQSPVLAVVLQSLHTSTERPLILLSPEDGWEEQLPPSSLLRGRCAVILIVSDSPTWLLDIGDEWSPSILLVVNANSSLQSEKLLAMPHIQRSPSLSLLEAPKANGPPTVYTSRPFLRNARGKRLFLDLVGKWDINDFEVKEDLFPNRFRTFGGEVLHVASDLDDYPLIFEDGEHLDGTNIRILDVLGDWLNFTYTTTIYAEDENWGELVNGSWNGLLGEVYRGTKNLTVNYFTVVYERSRDFEHTSSYFNEGFGFALRIPPPLPAWMSLLYPFSTWVWTSTACILLFMIPILFLLKKATKATAGVSVQDVTLEILAGILKQTTTQIFTSDVIRIFMVFWWLGTLILGVSYTCNLIAVLTVPVFPPKISSIQGLAESSFRVSMVDYGEFVPEALATSNDEYLKALGDRMDLVYNYEDDEISYEELVRKVLGGYHAIIETYSYLRNLLAHDEEANGRTYVLKEQIYQGALAFFLAKHTPWTGRLDQGLKRLVEAGLVNKWYTDIMSSSENAMNSTKEASKEKALTIFNLQGPFILLALGFLASTVAFVLELLVCVNAREKRQSGQSIVEESEYSS